MNSADDGDWLDRLSRILIDRRKFTVALVLLGSLGLASQIPTIEVDPTPERLMSSLGNQAEQAAEFAELFGESSHVIALLVHAEEPLDRAGLQYVHDLSMGLRAQDWVEHVDSLTITPLPRRTPEEEDDASLDSLEAELGLDVPDATPLSPEALDALSALVEASPTLFPEGFAPVAARLSGGLIKTDSLVDGPSVNDGHLEEVERLLDGDSLLEGRLISSDASIAVVALTLAGDNTGHDEVAFALDELDKLISTLERPAGVQVEAAGLPVLRAELVRNIRSDQALLIPLTLLVCIGLLFIAFRWWIGTILPIIAVALTAAATIGAMAVTGQMMNVINNIIPSLLIIIGICDSIHLIGRYREELASGQPKLEAARATLKSMAVACLLTSVTTAVGLASLVVAQTQMLQLFGLIAGAGVMIAYVVTILFLPGALSLAPRPESPAMASRGGRLEGLIVLMTAWILRHPKRVLLGSAMLLVGCLLVGSQLRVDHSLLDQFDEQDDVHRTTRILEESLDGVRPLEIVIQAPSAALLEPALWQAVDDTLSWSLEQPEVVRTMSASAILRQSVALISDAPSAAQNALQSTEEIQAIYNLLDQRTPHPLNSWLRPEQAAARVQIKLRDVGARRTLDFIEELEERLNAALSTTPHAGYFITGEAYTGSRGLDAVVKDLMSSLGTAVIIIFLILALLFRSARLGLISIPPNVIPLAITLAYMVIRGIPLSAATAIIFSISIGLAVDGTIHVLARFREEHARGLGKNAALLRAARGTGRAIVVSCLTLSAGFSVLLLSSLVPVRHFGELIAITVVGCLIGTMIVQPALLKLFAPSSKKA